MDDKRQNLTFDEVINRGLAAALLSDASAGIKVMIDGGVPPQVISRVLWAQNQRRATDWKHCKFL